RRRSYKSVMFIFVLICGVALFMGSPIVLRLGLRAGF
ncbi:hypothetical protein L195_g062190, partial [Trifolium pratense]